MGFEASGMGGTWERWVRPGAAYQVAIAAAILLAVAVAATAQAADRVALVIGNSKYQEAELRNPANDADTLSEALKGLDFGVIEKKDLDRKQMDDALLEFYRALDEKSLALFFYAGHGMQVKGENFLVPVGARIREEYEVSEECLNVNKVLGALKFAPSKLNVVILDCCRNNPYQRSWSRASSPKGLAAIGEIPEGMLVAFSTAPGTEAADGEGKNSPYSQELVRVLKSRPAEGLKLIDVFFQTGRAVKQASGQTPWLNMEASLPEYHFWKPSELPAKLQPTRRPATAVFTVREQDQSGPTYAGAALELLWRSEPGVEVVVLGQGTSDSEGKATIEAWLDARQQQGGEFLVLVSSGSANSTWPMRGFPAATAWNVYVPRRQVPVASSGTAAITNSIGMKLVRIPAGEFMMGSQETSEELAKAFAAYNAKPGEFKDEHPTHRVRITKPFFLAAYEVTVGQFRKFVDDSGYKSDAEKDGKGSYGWNSEGKREQKPEYTWRNVGFEQTDDHPVVNVSWNDAVAFCEWLGRKEGKTYRLPTEAEWEYACRAGTTTQYYSGDDPETLAQVGNVSDASAKAKFPGWTTISVSDGFVFTAPVGRFRPNAFGLYDMHGNVWEWCADWYREEYYSISVTDDPTGPALGSDRMSRGGAWFVTAKLCRSAYRSSRTPEDRYEVLGFRVAQIPADR
jgi:formylglycine-generating enzyme required for sulfatase activity